MIENHQTQTMERSHRPPPLNLTPPQSARNSRQARNSGQSRFSRLAESFQEYVAPQSMFADDDDWDTTCAVTTIRVLGDFLHILTSMLLLLIMAFFLNYDPVVVMENTGPQAVALIIILGLDILLDFQSIGRYDKKWRGWALITRMTFGLLYITIFSTYAAMGRAFPAEYTYWGLQQQHATPVVYMFLWILAVWNLVYVAISHDQFKRELTRYGRRMGVGGLKRREKHDDVEAGFKHMAEVVGHEKSMSVSSAGTTAPKPVVLRP